MATELGALQWTVTANIDDLKEKLEQSSKRVNVFANSLKAAEEGSKALLGGVLAVGAGVVGFGLASVKAYQESEQAVAQLEAAIKSTGGAAGISSKEFQDQASALQRLSGVSDEAVLASQAMLSTFTNLKGGVMKDATKTVLDMATAMNGGAIPNMEEMRQQSIQLGKALNNPKEGLTALTRVGVTFTEEQKKQIEALQDSGKMAEAQTVILNELSKEFGGSAEAAGKTFTGAMNIAQQSFGDFMELVGQGIVEHLRPLVVAFNEWFTSIGGAEGLFKRFNDSLVPIKDNLPIIAGTIAVGLVPALYSMATALWATFAPLAPWLIAGAALGLLIKEVIMPNIQDFKNILMLLATGDFNGGIFGFTEDSTFINALLIAHEAISKVHDAIAISLMPKLIEFRDTVLTSATDGFHAFVDVFKRASDDEDSLETKLTSLRDRIAELRDRFLEMAGNVWEKVKPAFDFLAFAFTSLWTQIATQLWPQMMRLKDSFDKLHQILDPYIVPVLKFIAGLLGGLFVAAIGGAVLALKGVLYLFQGLLTNVNNAIDGFVRFVNFIKDIPNKISGAVDKVKNIIDRLNPFHRESPSLVDNVRRGLDVISKEYSDMQLSLPDVKLAELGTMNMGIEGRQQTGSVSENHFHIGMFAGGQQELRKIVETISDAQSRIAESKGMA